MTDSFTLTWSELGIITPKGLELGTPTIKEDQHGNLHEISYPILFASEESMKALNDRKSDKPKLTVILENMLNAAKANQGMVQRRVLASGLNIGLIVGLDGMLRIQLYREKGKYPSDIEWRTTICDYFPIQLAERDPERFTAKGRGYLRAEWELPA